MANVWSIDTANETLTNSSDGGFTIDVPLLLNGVKVADITGVMTGAGWLEIKVIRQAGAPPINGFAAWSTNA